MRLALGIALIGAGLLLAVISWKLGLFAPKPLTVNVVGHNWWWELDYPGLGIKTANELHVPVDTDIDLEISSIDAVHTLSVAELEITVDAIPDRITSVRMHVEQPGNLGEECSEICATAHSLMRLKVVAESQDGFEAWVDHQQEPAAVPQTAQQQMGYEIVRSACSSCHSLDPAEPRTDLPGPNLAHLMSRSVFAGASFNLNEENLRRWLLDPQSMKTGNAMVVQVQPDDLNALIDYLLMLK
jgi:cytochrome c oxidase subunit 2